MHRRRICRDVNRKHGSVTDMYLWIWIQIHIFGYNIPRIWVQLRVVQIRYEWTSIPYISKFEYANRHGTNTKFLDLNIVYFIWILKPFDGLSKNIRIIYTPRTYNSP